MVDSVAGTTVDPVDELLELGGETWRFVDTAGLRRRVNNASGMEYYASLRTASAIEAAEVAVVLLDASEVISEQDQRVITTVIDAGRALVIAFNKWDLVDEDRRLQLEKEADWELQRVQWAPRVNVSAKTGRAVEKLAGRCGLAGVLGPADPTGGLNTWLTEVVDATHRPAAAASIPGCCSPPRPTPGRRGSCCSPPASWRPATGDSSSAGCGRTSTSRAARSRSRSGYA